MADRYDLGQEFFRWEIATAVAGSIHRHQCVQSAGRGSQQNRDSQTDRRVRETGRLPAETPIFEENGIKLFTDPKNAAALGKHDSLRGYLKAHLDRIGTGDYFALLGYIEMNHDRTNALCKRSGSRSASEKRVATCLGFGPRFLHSTGQAYKGGPNSGVFLQMTCDEAVDLKVPGQNYTFGTVKAAQARGDFDVLAERGRRALRVHLGKI